MQVMKPVVLMYHSVADSEPIDPYGVSRTHFCDQISWLIDQDYQFVPLATLVQPRKNGVLPKKRKQAVLTFDDGYRDFLINALPILLRHRLPATVFLVADMLGKTATWNSYGKEVALMTKAEVRLVKDQGVSLGSHTLTHVDLTGVGNEELQRQLVSSRTILSDFGETFYSFSYPWGRHTDREVAALKCAGYECAVTVGEPANFFQPDLFRLGRLMLHRDLDLESFKRMVTNNTWSRQIPARLRTLMHRVQERGFPLR
jgi:peptidoglycan/xylan/chitin deacetylase (PgdA/CDA1 family)